MSSNVNVGSLFSTAVNQGELSEASAKALSVRDIGAEIQAALGTPADAVQASDVVLVSMLIDDSGSIANVPKRGAGGLFERSEDHSQLVRDGHNLVLDALGASKVKSGILIHCRYLNGTVLYPYVPLEQSVRMDDSNYQATGGTPLYDQSVVLLGAVLAKTLEFADNGVPCRTVTLIVTDGHDEHSPRHMGGRGTTPTQVYTIVADMLQRESHIISAMGIDDGFTDFYAVFSGLSQHEVERARQDKTIDRLRPEGGMGVVPKWVLTPGNTEKEIRAAFNLFSQSAVRASQGAASFSKTSMGGFGA